MIMLALEGICRALGKIGDKRAIKPLLAAMDDENGTFVCKQKRPYKS